MIFQQEKLKRHIMLFIAKSSPAYNDTYAAFRAVANDFINEVSTCILTWVRFKIIEKKMNLKPGWGIDHIVYIASEDGTSNQRKAMNFFYHRYWHNTVVFL